MTNSLVYNQFTNGVDESKHINRVGAIMHDKDGNDISETNPLPVSPSGFQIPSYDYIAATYPTATTEVYTYKTGGVSGTTVAVLTLTFTDATKNVLSSVEKA